VQKLWPREKRFVDVILVSSKTSDTISARVWKKPQKRRYTGGIVMWWDLPKRLGIPSNSGAWVRFSLDKIEDGMFIRAHWFCADGWADHVEHDGPVAIWAKRLTQPEAIRV
jgi:hypothetical protein